MRRLELNPGFVCLSCLAFYLCPGRVFWPLALLSLLHEMGHLAALSVCGVGVRRIRLRALGAVIETEGCSNRDEALCALAGPAVNLFAFWALRRVLPGAALISLVLGVCNLLPVYPLDGGRALRAVCGEFLPPDRVNGIDRAVTLCVPALLGLCALRLGRSFGPLPPAACALLCLRIALERNLRLPRRDLSDIMEAGPQVSASVTDEVRHD